MLSTIGRAAVRRVVAPGPQSTNGAFRTIWNLQRAGTFHHAQSTSAASRSSFYPERTYATATKVSPKPKSTATKTAKLKKPAAQKAVKKAKKPLKKVAKKKKVVKKPVKKVVKKKKILSEEDAKKATVKALKAKALLSVPKQKPATAWTVVLAEYAAANPNLQVPAYATEASAKYKNLTPAELEHYNHLANQNQAANNAAYKQWVESHTPEQIRIANNARQQLKLKSPRGSWAPIKDDRSPKRPSAPMMFYSKDRYASGDLKGISFAEKARLVAKEWAAVPASERKIYEDRAATDRQRYIQEHKTVFGRDPPFVSNQKAPA